MKRTFRVMIGITIILVFLQISGGKPQAQVRPIQLPNPAPTQAPRADADFGKIPLQFIPNEGQTDRRAAFYVQGRDKTIFFAPEGLTFVLTDRIKKADRDQPGHTEIMSPAYVQSWVLKLDFVDANKDAKVVGVDKSGAAISYFRGKPEEWKVALPAYAKIAYRDLWPGIDLIFCGTFNQMKYEFVVQPGADPSRIRLTYRGAEEVVLDPAGRLRVKTPKGNLEDDIPIAYQEIGDERRVVSAAFELEDITDGIATLAASGNSNKPVGTGLSSNRTFGFRLGEYDQSRTLVVDPVVFVYCGYLGGASWDTGNDIDIDSSGCAYIVGNTYSTQSTFPVLVGPDVSFNGGTMDAFVAKINASGTSLVYCGYIGGDRSDEGRGIFVDGLGNAYIAGCTGSTEATFPVRIGPDLTFAGPYPYYDGFVAKVNPSGSDLIYCGYVGGIGDDTATDIVANESGTAFICGYTDSTEASFPVKAGPDMTFNGNGDAFVAKINSSGTDFVYCGYIGGEQTEAGLGIGVDPSGSAYVVGQVRSGTTFPVKGGPSLVYAGGECDGFITKVDPTGTNLVYSGYIGSTGTDLVRGIAVDSLGSAYVVGYVDSPGTGFPITVGPGLTPGSVYSDAFVAKLNPSGLGFVYCGYICGSGADNGFGIAIDQYGAAYVCGTTRNDASTFPVKEGPDLTYNGSGEDDGFVAKVDPTGVSLIYCGYIGGANYDAAQNIAVDNTGGAYIVGSTGSTQTTFPVKVGPDLTHDGSYNEAFVAKIQVMGPPPTIAAISPTSANAGDPGFALTVTGGAFVDGAVVMWDGADRQTTFVSSSEVSAIIGAEDLTLGKTVHVTVRNPDGQTTSALEFTIYVATPSLSSLVPSSAHAGDPQFTLVVNGSAFVDGAIAMWDGLDRPTTFISATQLNVTVLASDLALAKSVQVTVRNPGSSNSNALEFMIDDPVPILTSLVPSTALAGGPGFTLSVVGSKFVSGATVRWDGNDRPTTFVNSNEVDATIGPADIASAKSVEITVRNPDGRISSGLMFVINNPPAPTLTALSPSGRSAGGSGFNLTVLGTNFVANSVVKWNGIDKATTYVSSTELHASILAGDIAAGGEAQITVANPIPPGSTSNAIAFTVSSFVLNASPSSATVTAGQTASYALQVIPQLSSFDTPVSLTCSGLPRNTTASITPGTVTPGAGPAAVALSIVTNAGASSAAGASIGNSTMIPPTLGLIIAIVLLVGSIAINELHHMKPTFRWPMAIGILCLIGLIASCSSGGGGIPSNTGTPSGTYQVTIQGESGGFKATTTVTLVVR